MKLETMEGHTILLDEDREVQVDVDFYYYKGWPGNYLEPPEEESCEIAEVRYCSGARNEVEEAMLMTEVEQQLLLGDLQEELEDAVLQYVADEADRMADRHYDQQMQARIEEGL